MKNIPILCKIIEEFAELPLGNEKGKMAPFSFASLFSLIKSAS
jgi:hypothetical protein